MAHTLGLVVAIIVAFVVALASQDLLRDLFLGLTSQFLGALVTVVLIGYLWKAREDATTSRLDAIAHDLRRLQRRPLTSDEREAWQGFVDEYRTGAGSETLPGRLRQLRSYPRRIRDLEDKADHALAASEPPQ